MEGHVTWLPEMSSSLDMISAQVSLAVAQVGQIVIDVVSDFDQVFEIHTARQDTGHSVCLSLCSFYRLGCRLRRGIFPVHRKQVKRAKISGHFEKSPYQKRNKRIQEIVSLISWEGKL